VFAIAFALRGTLTQTDGLEREAFLALLRERCRALGAPFAADEAIAAAGRLFASDRRTTPAEMAGAAARLLDDPVSEAVLIARFRQLADRLAPSRVTSPADVGTTLERIASLGIPTAVLCNGWARIARREAECAGYFGPVLVSEDIGVELPRPRAFEKLIEAIGLPPECIWFVGNDPLRDIAGAAACGLTTVWYNPQRSVYPPDLAPPTLTVASFDDLLPPVCEAYTRSLLSLRHVMRTALEWREGHYLPPVEKW
jgi:FMN phosphatase YigB (HAD superfamily)